GLKIFCLRSQDRAKTRPIMQMRCAFRPKRNLGHVQCHGAVEEPQEGKLHERTRSGSTGRAQDAQTARQRDERAHDVARGEALSPRLSLSRSSEVRSQTRS